MVSFETTEPIIKYYSQIDYGMLINSFAFTEHFVYFPEVKEYMKRDFGNANPNDVYFDLKLKYNRSKYRFPFTLLP